MAYFNKYVTSLYGRRLGIQRMTTAIAGISKAAEFLVGPEAVRFGTTTSDSTSTNLAPYGHSVLQNSSAGSSQVWTLDPPIPGVEKTITFLTTANTQYLRTANSETILTSQGSSMTTIKSTLLNAITIRLVPTSTAQWGSVSPLSTTLLNLSTT